MMKTKKEEKKKKKLIGKKQNGRVGGIEKGLQQLHDNAGREISFLF